MTSIPTTVLDGAPSDQAARDGMSQTTFRATRPDRARFVGTSERQQPDPKPTEQAQPVKLIQIGPTDC